MGMDKPTIASVNGVAVAGGLALALACDFRIASDRARFGDTSIVYGFASDEGQTYLLPRIVGLAKALELILLGDIIDANEAQRLGLVNRVVPHDELEKATKDLATRLAKGPSIAQRLSKHAIYRHLAMDLESSLEDIGLAAQIANETEDAIEGTKAFLEKRPPVYKGR
jgi:enoyl-CoA hydratase/carnithine racemase